MLFGAPSVQKFLVVLERCPIDGWPSVSRDPCALIVSVVLSGTLTFDVTGQSVAKNRTPAVSWAYH